MKFHYPNNDKIEDIPDVVEIFQLVYFDFDAFFNNVVKDEYCENDFASQKKVVNVVGVFEKANCREVLVGQDASGGWEFKGQSEHILK